MLACLGPAKRPAHPTRPLRQGRVALAEFVDSLGAFRPAMAPEPEAGDSPASVACLYCPVLEMVSRWQSRGHNQSSGVQALAVLLSQWTSFYRLSPSKSAAAIDVMHSQDLERLKALVPQHEPLGPFLLAQMEAFFPFAPSVTELHVEPRLPYDVVINTSGRSLARWPAPSLTPSHPLVLFRRPPTPPSSLGFALHSWPLVSNECLVQRTLPLGPYFFGTSLIRRPV